MNHKQFFTCIALAFLLASCEPTIQTLFDKADNLYEQKKYDQAIDVYTQIIRRKFKLQRAFYNRGICYMELKKYDHALWDFNNIIHLISPDGKIIIQNQEGILGNDDETKAQIPFNDALYQRAQVYFYLDSLKSSFLDFQRLIDYNDADKSNCILWQGVIFSRIRDTTQACEFFYKAKLAAVKAEEKEAASKMIKDFCEKRTTTHKKTGKTP